MNSLTGNLLLSKTCRLTNNLCMHRLARYRRVLSLHDLWLDSSFSTCPSFSSSKHRVYDSASTPLRTRPCTTRLINYCRVVTLIYRSLKSTQKMKLINIWKLKLVLSYKEGLLKLLKVEGCRSLFWGFMEYYFLSYFLCIKN